MVAFPRRLWRRRLERRSSACGKGSTPWRIPRISRSSRSGGSTAAGLSSTASARPTEMERTAPTIYLLFGDDEFAIGEFVSRLREKLGDASSIALNTQVFEGPSLDPAGLAQACQAVPFLARRRLVVVHRAGACLAGGGPRQARFLGILESVPASTALVLVETSDSKAASPLH